MKTILLVIPRAVAARLVLQTDVLPALHASGVRVVALTPGASTPALAARVDPGSLILEPLHEPTGRLPGGRWLGLFRSLVRAMRESSLSGRKSAAIMIRYRRVRAAYSASWPRVISAPVHLLITQALWRSRTLRRLLVKLDVALDPSTAHADVFERYRPDLVVGAGLGYFGGDAAVYREAAKRGIRVLALVSGWDNIGTKGYRAVDFHSVVAWSERMREEIIDLHDVPPERVHVAGAPHWDLYFREEALPSREELFRELGLDPSKRLVLHANFPPSANPLPFERIAAGLAEATARGDLGDDVQLAIRLHPKYMRDDKAEARRPYEELVRHERVVLHRPEILRSGRMSYDTTERDARELGGLLKHCDVLVNVFSTTTLEGFLLDRPVVMALPDPDLGEYPRNSYIEDPRRWESFVHLRPLVESGAARIARSPDEVLEHVSAYLANPSLERDRRSRVAWLECGPTDGHAGARTAGYMLEALGLPMATPIPPAARPGVPAPA